ncbi:MAG: cobalamin biosynthesis protein, partial [Pseudomonadota bacterium]
MALEPIVISLTETATAAKIARALGVTHYGLASRVASADAHFEDTTTFLAERFAAGTPVIGVCAAGILIRSVASLLSDKRAEPPVISVSDDGRFVVPLLGGHRGANALAIEVAAATGGEAAVTTAGEVTLGVALDAPPPGWRLANPSDAKGAMAALLAGGGAELDGEAPWLNALPRGAEVHISATQAAVAAGPGHLHFAPQVVTLGVGCARNCPPEELATLVNDTLTEAGLSPAALHSVNTIDLKADEPAILALADALGVPLRLFSATALDAAADGVPNPSEVVRAEVGTRSVSEAAALLQSPESVLTVPKRKTANATCALAVAPAPLTAFEGRARGRLSVVGIGPGQAAWRTPEASKLIAEADELVGYGLYIDLLGPLAHGKPRSDFPLGGEEDRCRYALERAGEGRNVALICSGDAGIYAMGALVFELLDRTEHGVSDAARRAEVICAPGVSAL